MATTALSDAVVAKSQQDEDQQEHQAGDGWLALRVEFLASGDLMRVRWQFEMDIGMAMSLQLQRACNGNG